eukprot:6190753-Pleurochrysis_carterae.AAC.1
MATGKYQFTVVSEKAESGQHCNLSIPLSQTTMRCKRDKVQQQAPSRKDFCLIARQPIAM